MKKYSISNKDLVVFFIITFGITIIMGLVMGAVYPSHSVASFPLLQMYYPALGVMVVLSLNKERRNEIPKKFFGTYISFVVISVFIF